MRKVIGLTGEEILGFKNSRWKHSVGDYPRHHGPFTPANHISNYSPPGVLLSFSTTILNYSSLRVAYIFSVSTVLEQCRSTFLSLLI